MERADLEWEKGLEKRPRRNMRNMLRASREFRALPSCYQPTGLHLWHWVLPKHSWQPWEVSPLGTSKPMVKEKLLALDDEVMSAFLQA